MSCLYLIEIINKMKKNIAPPKPDHLFRGVAYGLACYFTFAIMQAAAKLLSEHHHVIEIVFYRNLIAILPLLIVVTARGDWKKLKTKSPRMVAFRGIFGTFTLMITYLTFHYLPMSEATVLLFTAVILTPMFAHFILHERIGRHRWAAIIIGLIGVMVAMRPSVNVPLIGIGLGFATAMAHASINIILRKLRHESSLTVVFSFFFWGVVISGVLMPFVATWPAPNELLLFLIVGVSGGLGQFFLTSAFQNAPASIVAPLNYTGLIWAAIIDIIVWNVVPGIGVFAGAAIIIASQGYILHRTRISSRKKNKNATEAAHLQV